MRRSGTFVALAAVTLATTAAARRRHVGALEERLFHRVNEAPNGLHVPVWLVMQSGSLGAVFVVGETVRRSGRPRAAVVTVAAGAAMWVGAKLVKPFVGRGRPAAHFDGVQVRGTPQSGLGFPSGHAAVAVTLALASSPPGRPGILAGSLSVATLTGLARVYVGAHLPLDVAGGWALGSIVGRAARRIVAGIETT